MSYSNKHIDLNSVWIIISMIIVLIGFKPYEELRKVVESRFLSKDVMKLSPAEQTSSLEAFHKVICEFAPKFVHYSHPQMQTR